MDIEYSTMQLVLFIAIISFCSFDLGYKCAKRQIDELVKDKKTQLMKEEKSP